MMTALRNRFTAQGYAEHEGISIGTARRRLNKMVEAGTLTRRIRTRSHRVENVSFGGAAMGRHKVALYSEVS